MSHPADEPWFPLAKRLIGPVGETVGDFIRSRALRDVHRSTIPQFALIHFGICLDLAGTANERGYHAPALALTRQCIEALSVVEAGIVERSLADRLLSDWEAERITSGGIRKELEQKCWPSYGFGLWNEPWAEFWGNLSRAVQEYAHYGPALMQWQLVFLTSPLDTGSTLATFGLGVFDPAKGHRIALLHGLTLWALGRIACANIPHNVLLFQQTELNELGRLLGKSRWLEPGKDWAFQLIPHVWLHEPRAS